MYFCWQFFEERSLSWAFAHKFSIAISDQPVYFRNGVSGKGKNMISKHDAALSGKKNANRVMDSVRIFFTLPPKPEFWLKNKKKVWSLPAKRPMSHCTLQSLSSLSCTDPLNPIHVWKCRTPINEMRLRRWLHGQTPLPTSTQMKSCSWSDKLRRDLVFRLGFAHSRSGPGTGVTVASLLLLIWSREIIFRPARHCR